MKTKQSHLPTTALVLGVWFMGSVCGQCYLNPKAHKTTQAKYGSSGETTQAPEPLARANPSRFSTKYQDGETDLPYYGYRFYNPNTGRWLNRDPIEEHGGNNLYAFALNSATAAVDGLGLGTWRIFEDTVDLNRPGINVKAQDPNGFSVIYTANPGECPEGEIKLYQIVSITGLRGTSATVDAPTDSSGHRPRQMQCPLPPIMTPPVPGVPCSYQDSPGGATDADRKFTAVAVCRRKCKELFLLSTYYFEFDTSTRKITKRDPSNQDHFRSGMKRWWGLDENWFIDFYYPSGIFW